jgi:hypothetical protein
VPGKGQEWEDVAALRCEDADTAGKALNHGSEGYRIWQPGVVAATDGDVELVIRTRSFRMVVDASQRALVLGRDLHRVP